jgi:hypothetical protein
MTIMANLHVHCEVLQKIPANSQQRVQRGASPYVQSLRSNLSLPATIEYHLIKALSEMSRRQREKKQENKK